MKIVAIKPIFYPQSLEKEVAELTKKLKSVILENSVVNKAKEELQTRVSPLNFIFSVCSTEVSFIRKHPNCNSINIYLHVQGIKKQFSCRSETLLMSEATIVSVDF